MAGSVVLLLYWAFIHSSLPPLPKEGPISRPLYINRLKALRESVMVSHSMFRLLSCQIRYLALPVSDTEFAVKHVNELDTLTLFT